MKKQSNHNTQKKEEKPHDVVTPIIYTPKIEHSSLNAILVLLTHICVGFLLSKIFIRGRSLSANKFDISINDLIIPRGNDVRRETAGMQQKILGSWKKYSGREFRGFFLVDSNDSSAFRQHLLCLHLHLN